MWSAMGLCYEGEALGLEVEAQRCYRRALALGDREGVALRKLVNACCRPPGPSLPSPSTAYGVLAHISASPFAHSSSDNPVGTANFNVEGQFMQVVSERAISCRLEAWSEKFISLICICTLAQ